MSGTSLALTAPAKINLALHVTGRRPDGYHLLDSIAVFADIGDVIEIAPAEALTLEVAGPFAAHAPGDRGDLAHRAAEAFFAHAGLAPAVSIRVTKNIPAGAGLGGGSADAAAVLRGLDEFFDLHLPAAELARIGLTLGADVPMCLAGRALRAAGIGEDITLLREWPPLSMVLAWPGHPVSTAEAFKTLANRENAPLGAPPAAAGIAEIAAWLAECRNDLEEPALALRPEIGDALRRLRGTPGCLLARMSGSGSACFGVYPTRIVAEAAAGVIGKDRPNWWIAVTEAR